MKTKLKLSELNVKSFRTVKENPELLGGAQKSQAAGICLYTAEDYLCNCSFGTCALTNQIIICDLTKTHV